MAGSARLVAAWGEAVGAVELALGDFPLALCSSQLLSLLEEEHAVCLQICLDGGGVGAIAGGERSAQLRPDLLQPGWWWWRLCA
jgi:hypothetical protein